jgi:hypothetical protein
MEVDAAESVAQPLRQPLARLGPSPRPSNAQILGAGAITEHRPEARRHQDSTVIALGSPPWVLSPSSNTDPRFTRRTSMQDAAFDVLQTTLAAQSYQSMYRDSSTQSERQKPQDLPLFSFRAIAPKSRTPSIAAFEEPSEHSAIEEQTQQEGQDASTLNFRPIAPKPIASANSTIEQPSDHTAVGELSQRPIAYHSPNQIVYGSKDSQKVYQTLPGTADPGAGFDRAAFSFRKGVGYICITCARVCPKPSEHRTLQGGAGCVDFSSVQPWRGLTGEGMQILQGQAEEEQRATSNLGAQDEATEAPRRSKGKGPVRAENVNPLGEVGPHETAFLMKEYLRRLHELEQTDRRVSETSGLFF